MISDKSHLQVETALKGYSKPYINLSSKSYQSEATTFFIYANKYSFSLRLIKLFSYKTFQHPTRDF
jgi:hypothetical protein